MRIILLILQPRVYVRILVGVADVLQGVIPSLSMTSTVPHFSTIDINTQDIAILRSLADNVGAQVLPLRVIDPAVDSISLTADAKAPSHRPLCRTRGMRFLGPIRDRRVHVIQRPHIGVVAIDARSSSPLGY